MDIPIACYKLNSDILVKNSKKNINIFNRLFNYYDPIVAQYTEYTIKKLTDVDIKTELTNLLEHSAKLFTQNGFKIDKSRFLIEIHQYNVVGKQISPTLDWHKDDYGAVDYEVCSMIYYIDKDERIIGGNIEFKDFGVVEVVPPMLVMFNGDLTHRPQPMNGNGFRDSIVVMFARVR